MPRSPLPVRNGLNSAWVRTPQEVEWDCIRDFLVWKIPRLSADRIDEMFAEGRFVNQKGEILSPQDPVIPNRMVFFHRDLPNESPPPGELKVVYENERIVVLDKPHFWSTIPRGRHVLYSATVQARRMLDLPELSPAHRLDRVTAGLLLCTKYRKFRAPYQLLFEHRQVQKTYEAIAKICPNLKFPIEVTSHIAKYRGQLRALELPDQPANAKTLIDLVEQRNSLGRYLVTPLTGKTHQIRLHMNRLGIPILNDPFYPVLLENDLSDFSTPLQLVAKTLQFVDPISGQLLCFETSRQLSCWTDLSK